MSFLGLATKGDIKRLRLEILDVGGFASDVNERRRKQCLCDMKQHVLQYHGKKPKRRRK